MGGGGVRRPETGDADASRSSASAESSELSDSSSSAAFASGEIAFQWPTWEVDEWETDANGAATVTAAMTPNTSYGAAPSIEEAEAAASYLRDGIDRGNINSVLQEQIHISDNQLGNSWNLPAAPGHVAQAFSFLQASPEAQSAVASLVADKNVWDAVMKNDKVMEYYRNNQSAVAHLIAQDAYAGNSLNSFGFLHSESSIAESILNLAENARRGVTEVVSNISNFFQGLFHDPSTAGTSSWNERGAFHSFFDNAIGGSVMALVVAVILVVLVKRS